jgi:hypothetical protein
MCSTNLRHLVHFTPACSSWLNQVEIWIGLTIHPLTPVRLTTYGASLNSGRTSISDEDF